MNKVIKLMRVGLNLRVSENQDLDEEVPRLVGLEPLSTAILELACALADDEREDFAAVLELVSAAKGDKKILRQAALGAKQEGQHLESRWANNAHRLLEAAVNDTSVASLSESDLERLEVLDGFSDLSILDRWNVLTSRSPELRALLRVAETGEFGRRRSPGQVRPMPDSKEGQAAEAPVLERKRLTDNLRTVVGPECNVTDVLLQSRVALATATYCLVRATDGSLEESACAEEAK